MFTYIHLVAICCKYILLQKHNLFLTTKNNKRVFFFLFFRIERSHAPRCTVRRMPSNLVSVVLFGQEQVSTSSLKIGTQKWFFALINADLMPVPRIQVKGVESQQSTSVFEAMILPKHHIFSTHELMQWKLLLEGLSNIRMKIKYIFTV